MRAPLIVMLLCTLAAGCAGVGEQVPQSFGGLPADVPARPAVVPPTPAVHDRPPPRADEPLDAAQQLKLEQDLAAARTRQHKLEDPNAEKRADDATTASKAAIERARKKAAKPPPE
jgi:hypothetical protein